MYVHPSNNNNNKKIAFITSVYKYIYETRKLNSFIIEIWVLNKTFKDNLKVITFNTTYLVLGTVSTNHINNCLR